MTIGIGFRISVIEGSNRDFHSGWTLSGLQDVGHAGVVTGRDGLSLPSLISAFPQDKEGRSEEHTSELQSRGQLVCRLLLEKKKTISRVTRCRLRIRSTRASFSLLIST